MVKVYSFDSTSLGKLSVIKQDIADNTASHFYNNKTLVHITPHIENPNAIFKYDFDNVRTDYWHIDTDYIFAKAVFDPQKLLATPRRIYLQNLRTHSEMRRKGLGREMVEFGACIAFERMLPEMGLRYINDFLLGKERESFYRNLGFDITKNKECRDSFDCVAPVSLLLPSPPNKFTLDPVLSDEYNDKMQGRRKPTEVHYNACKY